MGSRASLCSRNAYEAFFIITITTSESLWTRIFKWPKCPFWRALITFTSIWKTKKEEEWLQQMTAMQSAIADLSLSNTCISYDTGVFDGCLLLALGNNSLMKVRCFPTRITPRFSHLYTINLLMTSRVLVLSLLLISSVHHRLLHHLNNKYRISAGY